MSINRDEILRELPKFQVILQFDGAPDYGKLQSTLINCDNLQRKIVNYLNQIEPELSAAQNSLRNEIFSIDTKKRDIKTNVVAVKKLATGKERDEAADGMIQDDLKRKLVLENEINTLTAIKGSLMTTLKKLKGTEQNVKLLKTIADQRVSKLNEGTVEDKSVSELMRGLAGLDKQAQEMELGNEIGNTDDVASSSDIVEEAGLPEGDEESPLEETTTGNSTIEETQTLPEEEPVVENDASAGDSIAEELTNLPGEEPAGDSETISINDLMDDTDGEESLSEDEVGAEEPTDATSVTAKPFASGDKTPSKAAPEETFEEFLDKNPVAHLVIPGADKDSKPEEKERDISVSGSIDFNMSVDGGDSPEPKKSSQAQNPAPQKAAKAPETKAPAATKPAPAAKKPPETKAQAPSPSAKKVVEDKASVGSDVDILDLLNDFN